MSNRSVRLNRIASAFDLRLRRARGTYRFNVTGLGSWFITVGDANGQAGGAGDADCVISCTSEDAERILRGEENLLTAYLQRRIDVAGNLLLLLKLQETLRFLLLRRPALGYEADDELC